VAPCGVSVATSRVSASAVVTGCRSRRRMRTSPRWSAWPITIGIVTEVGIHSGEVRPAPCPRPT